MMFSLRNFIKNGLLKAIGSMADYQIILNAVGWFEKGVLLEEDLVEIQTTMEPESNMEDEVEDGTIFEPYDPEEFS